MKVTTVLRIENLICFQDKNISSTQKYCIKFNLYDLEKI